MAADVKFTVKKALDEQTLIPASVSEELEQEFIKKAKAFSIKLIPVSFIVAAVILVIAFLVIYFLHRIIISAFALICLVFPIYSIYDAFATSKALKNARSASCSEKRNTTPVTVPSSLGSRTI